MLLRVSLLCIIISVGYAQIVIDSSFSAKALWTQMGNVISYDSSVDAILISHLAYQIGPINVHSAPGDLSNWFHDENVYNFQFGPPWWMINTLASVNPYISFTTYQVPKIVAMRCDGWFSGNWEPPVNWGPDTVSTGPFIPYQLPDGNILFILYDLFSHNFISTVTLPDLSQPLTYDTIVHNRWFWGSDFNAGIGYIFYFDDYLNLYYRTTIDGINWNPEQTYDLVLPNPYQNNILCWTQVAVNDSGKPLLVFDINDGDDYQYGEFPWYGKVYVSYESGEPCVEVSSTFGAPDTECTYPTIATGENMAAVLYCTPRNNEPNGATQWDFYVNWSTDYGRTWGIPRNITTSFNRRPALPQLAKRIDTIRNRVYYIAAAFKFVDIDPYWAVLDGSYDGPIDVLFGYGPYLGITEETKNKLGEAGYRVCIYPNPFYNRTTIKLEIPNPKSEILLRIYDASGRLVKLFNHPTIQPYNQLTWDGTDEDGKSLPNGIYFVVLQHESERLTKKLILVK